MAFFLNTAKNIEKNRKNQKKPTKKVSFVLSKVKKNRITFDYYFTIEIHCSIVILILATAAIWSPVFKRKIILADLKIK